MQRAPKKTVLTLAAGLLAGLLLSSVAPRALRAPWRQDPAGKPVEEHQLLKKLAGSFENWIELKLSPDAEPFGLPGTTEAELILGGRFLLMRSVIGEGPEAIEQVSILGYDRALKAYTSISMDTTSTSMIYVVGKLDEEGHLLLASPTGLLDVDIRWDERGRVENRIHLPRGSEGETFQYARTVMTPRSKGRKK